VLLQAGSKIPNHQGIGVLIRGQLFIRSHDETLSVVAVRVSNPDRSPIGINR
jgi:hypothetical protein